MYSGGGGAGITNYNWFLQIKKQFSFSFANLIGQTNIGKMKSQ